MNMIEDDLSRKRQTIIDVSQRNQLESIQSEMRKNNEVLTSLRRENKELQLSLQQALRGQRNIDIDAHYQKEEELLHNKMCVLKRSLNAIRGKNVELTHEIERVVEENRYVQIESNNTIVDESSPIAQKIRALENRLDKCLVKHNEVNTIRRTYETLLERLQLEQGGFDTQLSSAEKALRTTEKEMQELINVGKDAARGRDQAKAEVLALKAQLQDDHQRQRKDLDQRRTFVSEKRETLEKAYHSLIRSIAQQDELHARQLQQERGGNQSATKRGGRSANNHGGGSAQGPHPLETPEEVCETVEWLNAQKEAYLTLRDATMQSSVLEVIQKYLERVQNNQTLQKTVDELQASLQEDRDACEALRALWEETNQRVGGAMVSSRVTRQARDAHEQRQRSTHPALTSQTMGTSSTAGLFRDEAEEPTVLPDYGLLAERANANRLVLEEFETHLKTRQEELKTAQEKYEQLSKLYLNVEAGVWVLADKLAVVQQTGAVGTPCGSHVLPTSSTLPALGEIPSVGLLRTCEAKVLELLNQFSPDELEDRSEEMNKSKGASLENNTRVAVGLLGMQASTSAAAGSWGPRLGSQSKTYVVRDGNNGVGSEENDGVAGSAQVTGLKGNSNPGSQGVVNSMGLNNVPGATVVDEFPDNEIRDRHELKMMALAMVEREEKKAYKQLAQRRKEVS